MAWEQDRGRFIPGLFDAIAPGYDAMNWLMTCGLWGVWRHAFRRLAPIGAGARVLDVGCGTGELSLLLARMVGARGHVTGVDVSRGMLAVGRRKVARAHLPARVTLGVGDAMRLPFADASFDAAASAFVLRNVADIDRMLTEMARVVRPGGHVVTMELSHPPRRFVATPFRWYFRTLPPLLGRWASRPGSPAPYAWLPASLERFPAAEPLAVRLGGAGLDEVGFRRLTGGIVCLHWGTKPGLLR